MFFIIKSQFGKEGVKFVPFNNFRISEFGAVGPVVLNSPTWKVSLPTVY